MATPVKQQLPIDFGSRSESAPALWLGFTLYHRELFDALQDEWASAPPRGARTLGVHSFPAPEVPPAGANAIAVHVAIDLAQLPKLTVRVRRAGKWTNADLTEVRAEDDAVDWPGALPLFAITRLSVATAEQRARLAGLAKQVSNVSLPDVPIDVEGVWHMKDAPAPPGALADAPSVPDESDALRGAITMALWGVPRIEPWLDILVASLSLEPPLSSALELVHAPWWATPPWSPPGAAERTSGTQVRLWAAAKETFRVRPTAAPLKLAKDVASVALNGATDGEEGEVESWLQETIGILRADVGIQRNGFGDSPVGRAIQLVLARPHPSTFKSWVDDLPMLPPGVWWTAATLCGLLTGYRRLDTQFRGDPRQRALVAYHALRCAGAGSDQLASLAPTDPPTWRRESGGIFLSWSGTEFPRKPEHARGKWFAADLSIPEIRHQAWTIAMRSSWNCATRALVLKDQSVPVAGDGTLAIQDEGSKQLVTTGVVRLLLPANVTLEESLDEDAFRRCMAEESGIGITEPPTPTREPADERLRASGHLTIRESAGQTALWIRSEPPRKTTEVPGLVTVDDFLSEGDEAALIAIIDQSAWLTSLSRRVQHYGWRYDYKARTIDASMRLGALPEWAERLARRLVEQGLVPHLADQVIVNEYVKDQRIAPHVDCETCFADGIAMISLLESWEMIFKPRRGKGKRVVERLERRSVAVMTGDARYNWTHEIPKRKTEPNNVLRVRRVSITLRKVIGVEQLG